MVDHALESFQFGHVERNALADIIADANAGRQLDRRQVKTRVHKPVLPPPPGQRSNRCSASIVLLPDMLLPVTNKTVPGGPTETSLQTRSPSRQQRMADRGRLQRRTLRRLLEAWTGTSRDTRHGAPQCDINDSNSPSASNHLPTSSA